MQRSAFFVGILFLFLLEFAFLPGLFTVETVLHIGLLILLAAMYGDWLPWMTGLLLYIFLSAFFLSPVPFLLSICYAGICAISWILTRNVLGARSVLSYLLYTGAMSILISLSHFYLFSVSGIPWIIFMISLFILLFFRFVIPLQSTRSLL